MNKVIKSTSCKACEAQRNIEDACGKPKTFCNRHKIIKILQVEARLLALDEVSKLLDEVDLL